MYNITHSRPWLYIAGLIHNWRECLIGVLHYWKLRKEPVSLNSVLVVEFNTFHGEVLPGVTKYFQELGYDVTVLTRYKTWSDSPFVRMEKKPRHYCLTLWGMVHYLKSHHARDYEYIFYNSARLYLDEYHYWGRVPEFLGGKMIEGEHGFGMIEHALVPGKYLDYFSGLSDDSPQKQQLFRNTFVLTSQKFDGHVLPMLNPCHFGNVRKKCELVQKDKRIFLAIGNISQQTRNLSTLFKILKTLNRNSFEFWLIGNVIDKEMLKEVPENSKVFGYLSFAEMYEKLEEADFFLTLLEPETQSKYLNGCTSGSRQLILGFCIPPIINRVFAKHYDFSEESSLTYENEQELKDVLDKAMDMSSEEYETKCKSLAVIGDQVYRQSLLNLEAKLNKACC